METTRHSIKAFFCHSRMKAFVWLKLCLYFQICISRHECERILVFCVFFCFHPSITFILHNFVININFYVSQVLIFLMLIGN